MGSTDTAPSRQRRRAHVDWPLRVDLAANVVVVGSRIVRVNGRVAEVMFAIRARYPDPVRMADLVKAIWGASPPANPAGAVANALYRARQVLEPLGWTVEARARPFDTRGAIVHLRPVREEEPAGEPPAPELTGAEPA